MEVVFTGHYPEYQSDNTVTSVYCLDMGAIHLILVCHCVNRDVTEIIGVEYAGQL